MGRQEPDGGFPSLQRGQARRSEKHKGVLVCYDDLVIDYVKEILAKLEVVHPAHDPKEGYELAGFVWFQGFNDDVGSSIRLWTLRRAGRA